MKETRELLAGGQSKGGDGSEDGDTSETPPPPKTSVLDEPLPPSPAKPILDEMSLALLDRQPNWREMWNPRFSMSLQNSKGLLNAPGQNNCFLNSAVQVLWHLDAFRRGFRMFSGHACMGTNSCIFCALKVIFTQFQYSDRSALPPDSLRQALAKTFANQQRFQLGHMDDAAECFENILLRIHFHIANQENEDSCKAKHCISHQKFAMNIVEQINCQCGANSEPHLFTQMVHYVSSSALVHHAKLIEQQQPSTVLPSENFARLLRSAASEGDIRNCPSKCGKKVQLRRTLTNSPDVVSIGMIWDSERPSLDHIKDVVRSIGTIITLKNLFHSVATPEGAPQTAHSSGTATTSAAELASSGSLYLCGVVCYYGKHYSTFFFHSKMKKWVYFDDATVREIGPDWSAVVDKCCRGHYQPLLLLYAKENGRPINMDTAPKMTTKLPGYVYKPEEVAGYSQKTLRNPRKTVRDPRQRTSSHGEQYSNYEASLKEAGSKYRRAVTPNPDNEANRQVTKTLSRRAITPNPEQWGRYDSDEDDAGFRKPTAIHFRQSSYMNAVQNKHQDHSQIGAGSQQRQQQQQQQQQQQHQSQPHQYQSHHSQQPLLYGFPPEYHQVQHSHINKHGNGEGSIDRDHRTNQGNWNSANVQYPTQSRDNQHMNVRESNYHSTYGTSKSVQSTHGSTDPISSGNPSRDPSYSNYTLSNCEQYRRPSGVPPKEDSSQFIYPASPKHNPSAVAKVNEIQRVESMKKSQGIDVVRFQPPSDGRPTKSVPRVVAKNARKLAYRQYGSSVDLPSEVSQEAMQGSSIDAIENKSALKRTQSAENMDRLANDNFDGVVQYGGLYQSKNADWEQNHRQANLRPFSPTIPLSTDVPDAVPPKIKQGSAASWLLDDWNMNNDDNYGTYINRKAVKSVLSYQKQITPNVPTNMVPQQQSSAQHGRTSNALQSAELPSKSAKSGMHTAYPLKVEIPDNVSLNSQRDSGYRSGSSAGDRNSESSISSASVDSPVFQHAQHSAYNRSQSQGGYQAGPSRATPDNRSLASSDSSVTSSQSGNTVRSNPHRTSHRTSEPVSQRPPLPSKQGGHAVYASRREVAEEDPYDYLPAHRMKAPPQSMPTKAPGPQPVAAKPALAPRPKTPVQLMSGSQQSNRSVPSSSDVPPASLSSRATPAPVTSSSASSAPRSTGRPMPPPKTFAKPPTPTGPKPAVPSFDNPSTRNVPASKSAANQDTDCEGMCMRAENLMEQSSQVEQAGNLPQAISLVNQAIGLLQEALNLDKVNQETKVYARMKHNTCVLRARSLQRRMAMRQDSGAENDGDHTSVSSMSTDTDGKDLEPPPPPDSVEDTRQMAMPYQQIRDEIQKKEVIYAAQFSDSGYSSHSDYAVPSHIVHSPTGGPLPEQYEKEGVVAYNQQQMQNWQGEDLNSANLYGTLPKRGGSKTARSSSVTSSQSAYFQRQKSTDMYEQGNPPYPGQGLHRSVSWQNYQNKNIDNQSSDADHTKPHNKMSKSDIRQMLIHDFMSKGKSRSQEEDAVHEQMNSLSINDKSQIGSNRQSVEYNKQYGYYEKQNVVEPGSDRASGRHPGGSSDTLVYVTSLQVSHSRDSSTSSTHTLKAHSRDNSLSSPTGTKPSGIKPASSSSSSSSSSALKDLPPAIPNYNWPVPSSCYVKPTDAPHSSSVAKDDHRSHIGHAPNSNAPPSKSAVPSQTYAGQPAQPSYPAPGFPEGGSRITYGYPQQYPPPCAPGEGSSLAQPLPRSNHIGSISAHQQSWRQDAHRDFVRPFVPAPAGGEIRKSISQGNLSYYGNGHTEWPTESLAGSTHDHLSEGPIPAQPGESEAMEGNGQDSSLDTADLDLPPPPSWLMATPAYDLPGNAGSYPPDGETCCHTPTNSNSPSRHCEVPPGSDLQNPSSSTTCPNLPTEQNIHIDGPVVTSADRRSSVQHVPNNKQPSHGIERRHSTDCLDGVRRKPSSKKSSDTDSVNSSSMSNPPKMPKSVLKKKRAKQKIRKSVSFSDNITLIASMEEEEKREEIDYVAYVSKLQQTTLRNSDSNSSQDETGKARGYDSDFDEDTSDSASSTDADSNRCNLCRKKVIEPTEMYCGDCQFYMSRFKPQSS